MYQIRIHVYIQTDLDQEAQKAEVQTLNNIKTERRRSLIIIIITLISNTMKPRVTPPRQYEDIVEFLNANRKGAFDRMDSCNINNEEDLYQDFVSRLIEKEDVIFSPCEQCTDHKGIERCADKADGYYFKILNDKITDYRRRSSAKSKPDKEEDQSAEDNNGLLELFDLLGSSDSGRANGAEDVFCRKFMSNDNADEYDDRFEKFLAEIEKEKHRLPPEDRRLLEIYLDSDGDARLTAGRYGPIKIKSVLPRVKKIVQSIIKDPKKFWSQISVHFAEVQDQIDMVISAMCY